ncbi:hypothetical protein NMY22_g9542 [Coprinellus aureogranulatus]|nr:hypothetical protein NMY22_g9542 [Coprinellus aureogranulatus]
MTVEDSSHFLSIANMGSALGRLYLSWYPLINQAHEVPKSGTVSQGNSLKQSPHLKLYSAMVSLKSSFVAFVLALPTFVAAQTQTCTPLPAGVTLRSNPKLPDPFTFYDGTKVTTKEQWECRREELSQLFQRFELGQLPPKPETVTGTIVENKLVINVTHDGKTITFNATITLPEVEEPEKTDKFPAIISLGGAAIPYPPDIARVAFNNDEIGVQTGAAFGGQGKFYQLYGADHPAGATTAWAWGVGRVIDALESLPDSPSTSRSSVSPAALVTARSGAGGDACWRISDALDAAGANIQTARQLVTENAWFSPIFNRVVSRVTDLPFDHHLLAALVAPRGLLTINHSGIDWLGPQSAYGCMKVGRKVYEALGVADHMGISLIGDHNHCQFPEEQQPELNAFIDKFLRGNAEANTTVVKIDLEDEGGFVEADWVDWTTPELS